MKAIKIFILISTVMLFTACGGGGSSVSDSTASVNPQTPETSQTIAIDKIKAYADDNTLPAPTIQDYTDAGVTGVTVENIDDVNSVVASLNSSDIDTAEEIQKIVDDLAINTTSVSLKQVSVLDDDVRETSGLAYINGKFYTHNDSGGSELLYEINATTGGVIRSITVNGASNVDWEDLAYDGIYLYIADTGNNLGKRIDLKIYKILASDLDTNNMVNAEMIAFSYADQTTFTYDPLTTPYDAEALIAYDGQLYIFTKNWADYTSKIYAIPTKPGSYEVTSVGEKTLDVMVTGADSDGAGNPVVLVGYTNPYDKDIPFKSIIVKLDDFAGNNFFSGNTAGHEIKNSQVTGQIESIVFHTPSQFYLSAEGVTVGSVSFPAKLFETEIPE